MGRMTTTTMMRAKMTPSLTTSSLAATTEAREETTLDWSQMSLMTWKRGHEQSMNGRRRR
uniref:Uncharacterized protein n=1 Tax=Arundo donax TaxID=35708 RepID=A0A0A9G4M8_ARUDO